MREIIEKAFPACTENGCVIDYTNDPLYIHDPKDAKSIITADQEIAHFIVFNPAAKPLTFTAIDHCIWGDDSIHQKCDFAITDKTTFVFVEIKDTHKKSTPHKTNAKGQLEDTIKEFDRVIDMSHLHRKAIIGWKFKKTYPAAKTRMQIAEVHFWDKYKVELMEGNSFSF